MFSELSMPRVTENRGRYVTMFANTNTKILWNATSDFINEYQSATSNLRTICAFEFDATKGCVSPD